MTDSLICMTCGKTKEEGLHAGSHSGAMQHAFVGIKPKGDSTLIGWGEPCKGFYCGCDGCIAESKRLKGQRGEISGDKRYGRTIAFVACPVCGESDMRKTQDDDIFYIHCVNGACGSNGGNNFSAIKRECSEIQLPSDKELIQKMLDAQPIREPVIKSTTGVVTSSEIKHQALVVKLKAGLEALHPYLREPKREIVEGPYGYEIPKCGGTIYIGPMSADRQKVNSIICTIDYDDSYTEKAKIERQENAVRICEGLNNGYRADATIARLEEGLKPQGWVHSKVAKAARLGFDTAIHAAIAVIKEEFTAKGAASNSIEGGNS